MPTIDPTWASLLGVLIGGLLGFFTTRLTWKLNEGSRKKTLLQEAYVNWAEALESTLSNHENYYRLKSLAETAAATSDAQLRQRWQYEIVDVSRKAGESGRHLDSCYYRLLLLEPKQKNRLISKSITGDSKAKHLSNQQGVLEKYTSLAEELRMRLADFLTSLQEK